MRRFPRSSSPVLCLSALALGASGCGEAEVVPPGESDSGLMLDDGVGVGPAVDTSPHGVTEVVLRLATRDGISSQGWSFSEGDLVDAEDADLLLSSWDCGARGRWVSLVVQGHELCHADLDGGLDPGRCGHMSVEVGGSDPELPLGGRLFLQGGDRLVSLVLVDRTETPFDWYEADDLSFEVVLEAQSGHTKAVEQASGASSL